MRVLEFKSTTFKRLLIGLALSSIVLVVNGVWAQTVTFESLLDEMVDRTAITKIPNYTCKQASSYDRASKSPTENWFANADSSQFIRSEMNGDREEWVLLDAEGPGAVVRWWITAGEYKNNFRIYIDGAKEPTIMGNVADIVGGNQLVGNPLSAERSRGRNLYLPIPYAKSIKITCDNMKEQGCLYYQICYRTYASNVEVESFSVDQLNTHREKLERVCKQLLEPAGVIGGEKIDRTYQGFRRQLSTEEIEGAFEEHNIHGPGAITEIDVKLSADDMASATRNVILSISFDGEETVWVPVGEFFGSGVGVNPNKTWYAQVLSDGTMKAFWRMPFKNEARVSFINVGEQDVLIDYTVLYEKAPWTDDTMYFHANWRQERGIKTVGGEGVRDWNYTALEGQGVYVGDVLSLVNTVPEWWGEGDEKIFVDSESFPSHFGTGSEDYYGYAWGSSAFFEDPFHAQPRCEGPVNFGNTTNLRLRSLDGIPFTKDFKFDIEIWHWVTTVEDYAVATFWYGAPGAKIVQGIGPDREALEDEASAPVEYVHKFVYKFTDFDVVESNGGNLSTQDMKFFQNEQNAWKDSKQILWKDGKEGDTLVLKVKNVPLGKTKLKLGATVARDYGNAKFYWNNKEIGKPVDFYFEPKVEHREVVFNVPKTSEQTGVLKVELIDKNEKSAGVLLGFDSVEWE